MPPNSNGIPPSSLGIKPPPRRNQGLTNDMWLEDKILVDNTEGFWRVHDNLYDLTEFINIHPGGAQWLELSKGLDITEAFEVHHITTRAKEILKKYLVKRATGKRNAPFTFKEDGFYKTLQRKVAETLPTLPKSKVNLSNLFTDSFLIALFILSILAIKYWSFLLGTFAGNVLAFLTIAAHNYLHHKDNFRMYYFNFSLQTVRDWRISHVLSHHLHTNTIDDLELSTIEPFLQYLPIKKSPLQRYGQLFITPLIWMSGFHVNFLLRAKQFIIDGRRNHVKKTDLIPFLLPLAMYIFSGETFSSTFIMWNFMIMVASTHLFIVGLHAGHHHPEVFHDGDKARSEDGDYDWGISQLDAVMDRKEITGSPFLVLTNFGDHALHHFFPTLDHGTLNFLYPVFKTVLAEFDTNLRVVSQFDTFCGSFQQLMRTEPSSVVPDLKKYDIKKYI